ncbi:MAG: hypothetical protein WBX15_05625 [Thermoanaerobaculia bacterium]
MAIVLFVALPVAAQQRSHPDAPVQEALQAEQNLRQAMQRFAEEKKVYQRDLAVLEHLGKAHAALEDAMQPAVSLEKCHDEVEEARRLITDPLLFAGVRRVSDELESARRSPGMADFDRLRTLLVRETLNRARAIVAENSLRVQNEVAQWLAVQKGIADHLQDLNRVGADSLRKSLK